jgi:hypothetical protein
MSIIRPSRRAAIAAAAATAAAVSTTFVAVAAASPVSTTSASRMPAWSSHAGWPGPAAGGWGPGAGPATWAPGSANPSTWGPGSADPSAWAPGRPAAHTEYFHVVSTKPSGPGTIIVTGVVNAGGTEKPGRAIDGATFANGSFRIDHSAGKPSVRFDSATCVGIITQAGAFEVIDATGDMRGLAGRGRYVFRALYTTARVGTHCSSTMTAYTETIEAVAKVKA